MPGRSILPRIAAGLALLALGWTAPLGAQQSGSGRDEIQALYEGGIPFAEFLANANRRRAAWHDHYENGAASEAAIAEAAAIGMQVQFLVVAEDWCGDSVNTVPYLARLVEAVDGWEMRVVNSTVGAGVMDANQTPDGRAATPTILVLDPDSRQLGVFVERPRPLQEWFLSKEGELPRQELFDQKYAWYDEDRGAATVRELTEIVRRAAGVQ